MGSFRGHAVPGTFFFFFGLVQTTSLYRRYFESLFEPHRKVYVSSAAVPYRKWPVEAVLKLSATAFGILGEAYTGFDHKTGEFVHIHNGQHITMFGFFFLNGVVDLLYHFKVPGLPKGLDYLSAIMAFAMEGE